MAFAIATGFRMTPWALGTPPAPPALPVQKPVHETYFGTEVIDPYRYFENESDPAFSNWIKAEGHYAAAVFASMPGRNDLLKRVSKLTASFDLIQQIQVAGDNTFYLERQPGSDSFDLMVRDLSGTKRKLIDVAKIGAANRGEPFAINYFLAANSGGKVAVGLSRGGSEDASMTVYDVATAKPISPALPRVQFGAFGWSRDDKWIYINQLAELPGDAPSTEKYQNSSAAAWDMKGVAVPLLNSKMDSPIKVPASMFPTVMPLKGANFAMAKLINGTQDGRAIWIALGAGEPTATSSWVKLADFGDGITSVAASGDRIYLLSHKDAPTFKVLMMKSGQSLSSAATLIAAQPARVIEGIGAAADGLYIRSRRGLYSELSRIPLDGGQEETIALPIKGSISEAFTDPTEPGVMVEIESWAIPPSIFRFDPATAAFAKLDIGEKPTRYDPDKFVVSDLQATAIDGTRVPLSYVEAAGAKRPSPIMLSAYGFYGISQFPYFAPRFAQAMEEGLSFAVCHVRGGGELGEAWRLGGKDGNKPNSWRDLIACGEELVAKGYTTKQKLFIMGGSAGGITVGRAMEERPDLFGGVVDLVPVANTTRHEFSPSGVPNVPEFGTVKSETGFRTLLAMDTYLNVREGVKYPPILIATGLNDPQVAPWEPGKLAARLRAVSRETPVLLRVDEQAGHGVGSTKTQNDELYTDAFAFALWWSGVPAYQPNQPAP